MPVGFNKLNGSVMRVNDGFFSIYSANHKAYVDSYSGFERNLLLLPFRQPHYLK